MTKLKRKHWTKPTLNSNTHVYQRLSYDLCHLRAMANSHFKTNQGLV